MTLTEILFGSYTPPAIPGRVHRSGISGPRYVPPKPRAPRVNFGQNTSEQVILGILKREDRPLTSMELEPMTGMTRNHCGIILTSLFKKGYVKRVKCFKPGTRFYKYMVKDEV